MEGLISGGGGGGVAGVISGIKQNISFDQNTFSSKKA